MDGITLAAVRHELSNALTGGKIEKIQQPEKDELVITLRGASHTHRLLLCAGASHARAHLTQIRKPNPPDAPTFCMLLRRRLTSARVVSVTQSGFDRVLSLQLEASDELGEPAAYTLITEIMGKHANIILVGANGIIVDSIKRVTPAVSRVRCVLPGLEYTPPPSQNKLDPSLASFDDFLALCSQNGPVARRLFEAYAGLSPATADALLYALWGDDSIHGDTLSSAQKHSLAQKLTDFFASLCSGLTQPVVLYDDMMRPVSLQLLPPPGEAENYTVYSSVSEALEAFYAERDKHERLTQRHSALHRTLNNHLERVQKKLQLQQEILWGEEKREQDRRFGELITANLHAIPRGASAVTVEDYYRDPPERVTIPLESRFSASDNAQRYFKRYRKARVAAELAKSSVVELEDELLYIEGQLDNLRKCTEESEVQELRDELIELGLLRKTHARKKAKQKQAPSEPMRFRSSDGIDILVGKNNAQNEWLTLRAASSEDTWLHTQRIPGSHVIVRASGVPERTLKEAATLAAYFSRARCGAQVPVDYTLRKNIRKPAASRPGYVIYTTHRTLYVTPDESILRLMHNS